ncbi:MAG: cadmium-translocating P-type ATPase [Bacteroidales bacterium]|jgi:Cd2+/Zn2+-exporting ATPase|nr:cadmium-translocating P-type ATPase [Bacteroidales bacterium]
MSNKFLKITGILFNEYVLMGLSMLGAFYLGEYIEGIAIVVFFLVGEFFQERAVKRAKKNIRNLIDARPNTARVLRNNAIEEIPPEHVIIGDILEIRAGESVPVDGILDVDVALFNTAVLTGESVPRIMHKGGKVLSGMIASDCAVRITADKTYENSAFSRIIEMVQNATERKAGSEKFIRKFARIYTPLVIFSAALVVAIPTLAGADFDTWLYRALIFLVASCPCALVISIPLGFFGGVGLASRNGILFKGGNYLDAITHLRTVVFDKTGTLTKGVFEVQNVEGDVLQAAASIEKYSNHPIAKSIVEYALKHGIYMLEAADIKEQGGLGLSATIDGTRWLVGNTHLLEINGIAYPQEIKSIVETIAVCACNGKYAGYITVADEIKNGVKETISELKNAGINTVMLSGDKNAIVEKTARETGIDKWFGELMPDGKVEKLTSLKNAETGKIAFVGDGINDAPVIAISDIGIAMGGMGSDIAIETADVVIQTDNPFKVVQAIKIGRTTGKVVWQNITLSLGVKFIVLLLGVLGLATLWAAVIADVGVAFLAIFNASRILGKKV